MAILGDHINPLLHVELLEERVPLFIAVITYAPEHTVYLVPVVVHEIIL